MLSLLAPWTREDGQRFEYIFRLGTALGTLQPQAFGSLNHVSSGEDRLWEGGEGKKGRKKERKKEGKRKIGKKERGL